MLSTINSTKWPRDKNKMIVKDFTLMQTDNLIFKIRCQNFDQMTERKGTHLLCQIHKVDQKISD